MGIDFSHGKANWSYSGFHRFRTKIAHACGLLGDLGKHFDQGTHFKLSNHAIFPFINHSDCDGKLTVDEMKSVVPVLKDIIKNWPDDDFDKIQGQRLIEGMEEAIERKEDLEFI